MKVLVKLTVIFSFLTLSGVMLGCGGDEGGTKVEGNQVSEGTDEDDLVAGASRENFILSELCCGNPQLYPFESVDLEVWLQSHDDEPGAYEGIFFEIIELNAFDPEQESLVSPRLSSRRVAANAQGAAKVRLFIGDFAGEIVIGATHPRANELQMRVTSASTPEIPLISNIQGKEEGGIECTYPKSMEEAQDNLREEIFINLSRLDQSEGYLISSFVENQLVERGDEDLELMIDKVAVLFPQELNTFINRVGDVLSFSDAAGQMVSMTSTFRTPVELKPGRAKVIQSPLISNEAEAELFHSFFEADFADEILSFMALVYIEASTIWGLPVSSQVVPLIINMCQDCGRSSTALCN